MDFFDVTDKFVISINKSTIDWDLMLSPMTYTFTDFGEDEPGFPHFPGHMVKG